MRNSDDEDTSIGGILIAMGLVNDGQLAMAIHKHQEADRDTLIGLLLVSEGVITEDQLEEALSAQEGLRSWSRHKRALAQADIAQASGSALQKTMRRIRNRSAEVRREATGDSHLAITPPMLATKDSG